MLIKWSVVGMKELIMSHKHMHVWTKVWTRVWTRPQANQVEDSSRWPEIAMHAIRPRPRIRGIYARVILARAISMHMRRNTVLIIK